MWLVYFSGSECWFEERRRCDVPLPRGIYHLSFSRRSPGKSLNSFPLAQIDSLWGESGAESFAGSEGKPESQEDEPTALWVPREGRGLLSPPPSAGSVGGHHFKHNPSCLIKRCAAPYSLVEQHGEWPSVQWIKESVSSRASWWRELLLDKLSASPRQHCGLRLTHTRY